MSSAYFTGRARASNITFKEHEVILQTLERESNGIYLNKAAFEKTLDKWEGTPVIFADDHVDFDDYDDDPEAELERVNGRIVGKVVKPDIEEKGHPRLHAFLDIDDSECEHLIDDGKLSPSTAFKCANDGHQLTGEVDPHHVLVFVEEGDAEPGDKGAFILNTQDEDGEALRLVDRLKNYITRNRMVTNVADNPNDNDGGPVDETYDPDMESGDGDQEDAELQNQDPEEEEEEDEATEQDEEEEDEEPVEEQDEEEEEEDVEQLKNELAVLKGELAQRDNAIAQLKEAVATFKQEKADKAWDQVKNTVPPGMVADEAKARELWEKDPTEFAMKVIQHAPDINTQEDGLSHIAQRSPTGGPHTVGFRNPHTGEWE